MNLILKLIAGIVAGIYPAIYLSALSVIRVIRKGIGRTGGGAGLRRVLVVFQFAVSVVLMICTMILYQQLN